MSDRRHIEGIDSPYSVTFEGAFSTKLATNTFFNFLGRFWSFVVVLLLTPYILSRLSVAEFGIWVLLSVFVGSFALLDLGLGLSFVKFVSQYHAHSDYGRINRILSSGVLFYLAFGVVVVAAGLALRAPLFDLFNIDRGQVDPGVYELVLVAFGVNNLALLMLSMLRGLQRMDQSNAIEILMSIPHAIGTVVLLELGLGIRGLALNAVIVAILTTLAGWRRLVRVEPAMRLVWHADFPLVRDLLHYGVKMQVGRLGALVCFQVDKLIISRFAGVAAVSFYEVSARLTLFMRALPLVMISALIPAVSELGAREDRERVLKTYAMASKYLVVLGVALVVYVMLEAESLLYLWLGEGFSQSVLLVQILAIGYGVNAMSEAASQTGSGVGRPDFDMRGAILLIVLNPVLSLLLVQQYGPPGAALGTTLALISSACYVLWSFHRHWVGSSVGALLRDIHLRPWLGALLAAAAVWGLERTVPEIETALGSRLLTPLKLLLDLAVFTGVYAAALTFSGHLTAVDWRNLKGLLAFGAGAVRRRGTAVSGRMSVPSSQDV